MEQRPSRNELFRSTFTSVTLSHFKKLALDGELRHLPFRSLFWKLFFEVISPSPGLIEGPEEIKVHRDSYETLRNKLMADPRQASKADATLNNPLSQSDESPWAKFFQNEELMKQIEIDVERTFPDSDFFRDPSVQKMMANVLFVYAKNNPSVGYKQGMHELLAPIIYLIDREKTHHDGNSRDIDGVLTDSRFIEHDAAEIFYRLMRVCHEWFITSSTSPPQQQAPTPKTSLSRASALAVDEAPVRVEPISVAVRKCNRIYHILLKSKDNQLYQYLESQKIEPQIYCLKWVRLLFGREFHLEDVLTLWDAIFASDISQYVEYIAVAMLVYVREQVIGKDSMQAMKRLLKFPPVEDITTISKHACQLQDPSYKPFQKKSYAPPPVPVTSSPMSEGPLGSHSDRGAHQDRAAPTKISSVSTYNPTYGIFQSSQQRPASSSQSSQSQGKITSSIRSIIPKPREPETRPIVQSLQSRVDELEAENERLIRLQQQMSEKLQLAIETLQAEYAENGTTPDENKVQITIAELKQVKDVLSHTLVLPEEFLPRAPVETPPEPVSTKKGKAIDPLGALVA